MLLAWMFVLVPLVLFLAGFLMEMYGAFRRLKVNEADSMYLDTTWELTHTLLVVSVAVFVGLFSQNLVEIAKAAYYGIFLTAVFVGVRTLCYVYLFYIRARDKKRHNGWVDYTFAYSYVGIVLGLGVLLAKLVPKLFEIDLVANTQFIPFMWPGLIIVLGIGLVPALSLYRTKR